jgi:hypothetical protein
MTDGHVRSRDIYATNLTTVNVFIAECNILAQVYTCSSVEFLHMSHQAILSAGRYRALLTIRPVALVNMLLMPSEVFVQSELL